MSSVSSKNSNIKTEHPYASESAYTSLKRARCLFAGQPCFVPEEDPAIREAALQRRRRKWTSTASKTPESSQSSALTLTTEKTNESTLSTALTSPTKPPTSSGGGILVKRRDDATTSIPTPTWHAPWKLSTVLSSHLGWVYSIAVDRTTNRLFATGSADSTIKIWDLPKATVGREDALKITLTGHIGGVRGLAFSERHPYLFSCAEDKTVKCWDLETNQVIRHYHGHLSGVYSIALHPTLDILITAGRDAVARVWDMRTKTQLHVLSGHEHTVSSVLTASTHPQVITGSHDCTIKLWDLAAGKCFTTLTHHRKAIRGLAHAAPGLNERTFVSAAADGIRKFQGKDGKFLHKIMNPQPQPQMRQQINILNAIAVQDDGVMVSGGDDGSLDFWDYKTGYRFQRLQSQVQPGSLAASENGILALDFDVTGTRLISGEADKSIKIWKPVDVDEASELSHPVDMKAWRKQYMAQTKERF